MEDFKNLISLTSAFNPEIKLLYLNIDKRDEKEVKENMENFISEFPVQKLSLNILKNENVEDGALEFMKKSNADVLSISGHGSGDYYTQLRTSISEKTIEKSSYPVLIFRIDS
ncbi:MAG: hypothetical protein M3Q58_17085 [Bacteroidota bacterium]|nr:hypothetical protein [Bacteroidota bacterium]